MVVNDVECISLYGMSLVTIEWRDVGKQMEQLSMLLAAGAVLFVAFCLDGFMQNTLDS